MKSLMSSSQILDKHTIFDMFCSKWTSLIVSHISDFTIDARLLWKIHSLSHLRLHHRCKIALKNQFSLTSQTSPSIQDCSEKSILSKPINDNIYLFFLIIEKHLFWLEPIVLVMSCYCLWYSWVNQFTNSNWWSCNWNCCFL